MNDFPYASSRRTVVKALAATAVAGGFSVSANAASLPRSGTVKVPGAALWYEDSGGPGEAIILLHPATGSAAIWAEYQVPAFTRAGYRVIAYSRRGHRGSPVEPGADPGRAADDLHALVGALKLDRFHLLGSAAGGFAVPDYALTHPDRVASMIIACSQGGCVEPSFRAALARMLPPEFSRMPASFRELAPGYRALNLEGTAKWEALEHGARIGERVNQGTINRLDWAGLARIRVPALIIAASADLYIPPALARIYADHIPGSRYELLPDSGHSGYWEQPELFNTFVLDFVGRHRIS